MIDHFHAAVLLYPKLTDNDVVHTTGWVGPGVGFIIPAEATERKGNDKRSAR